MQNKRTIRLMKCDDCGAEMEMDDSKRFVFCPYCGSKQLLPESEELTRARIKSEVIRDILVAREEAKRARMEAKIRADDARLEREKERIRANEARHERETKSGLICLIIFFAIIALGLIFGRS